MNHRYMTRFQKKLSSNSGGSSIPNDDFLTYDSDLSTDSNNTMDELSVLDSNNEEDNEMFSFDEEEVDEEEDDEYVEEKKVIPKRIPKNNQDLFNILLANSDPDQEHKDDDENFLDSISETEKKELLKMEHEISKMNHKKIPIRYQILQSGLSIELKAMAIKKLEAIQKADEGSNEMLKLTNWLNGLLKIPFGIYHESKIQYGVSSITEISSHLSSIQKELDQSVFGHHETKTTLLEIVASWITNPTATPTIIGIQGPPGTGKTTLIKNGVAKALQRPFSMISLGGAKDSSFLEGHGYTYEGSCWGRLVSILMECKCMNPIIYMDELDKISETKHGDEIVGILTHLIDYSQNNDIQDKYFSGIPLDFSKALFIFSFNDEDKINPILKDRIRIIRIESESKENKLMIAKNYIIPNLLKNVNFNKDEVLFSDDSIRFIMDRYCEDEEGVRNLKRCLESIVLKLNTHRLTHTHIEPYQVTPKMIEEFFSKSSFNHHDKKSKIPHMYL